MPTDIYPQISYSSEAEVRLSKSSSRNGTSTLFIALTGVLLLVGLSTIGWSIADSRFRDVEGTLQGTFCLPLAVGVALVLLAFLIPTRLSQSAFWFSLSLVGQAATLQIISAGSAMRYQHYEPLAHPYLVGFLILQAALVAFGYRNRWRRVWSWLRQHVKTWQLLAICIGVALSSATVSQNTQAYLLELSFATLNQLLNLATVVLVVWTLPGDIPRQLKNKWRSLFGTRKALSTRSFALVAALWVTCLAATLSYYSYGAHPHVPDEVSYVYQARYFAAGLLTMPAPPVPAAFQVNLMNYEPERWYSVFPPGWPGLLAFGVFIGLPWLINPLLTGFNVIGAAFLFRELYDDRTARLGVLLLCCSPWFVFMGMNFMSHTFALTGTLAAGIAFIWARKTGKARWALASGVAIGVVSLTRPLDGFILAVLFGLWSMGLGGKRLSTISIASLVLGTIISASIVLPYNQHLTGKLTELPVNAYFDKYYWPKVNAMGFGPERGPGWPIDPNRGHGPVDAIINSNLNITSINFELLGWSTGSLLLIILLLGLGGLSGSDWLMFALIAAIFSAHFFYYFAGGPDFGARYWYLMLIPCIALTARSLLLLESKLTLRNRIAVGILVGCLCLSTLISYFPWRAIDKYHNYLGMRPDVRYLAREQEFGKSLILIQGNVHTDYASAVVYNPPNLQADAPIFAWDRNQDVRRQVLEAYNDRPVWVVAGPSITGASYSIVRGPLTAIELMKETATSRF